MGIKNLLMKGGENSDGSLKVFQFMNFIVWICYFSPVIVAGGITCMSFLYQNFKGFIYLFFLISICLFRNFLYSGGEPVKNDGTICTKIQYSDYKNSDLYKEIVANGDEKRKQTKAEKKEKVIKPKAIDNILISINKSDYTELQNDVNQMKNEIVELKTTIKELVEMMKAVYDFEDA